jgi:hypothetical protein
LVEGSTDDIVWDAFGGKEAEASRPDYARLVALPMRNGVPLYELADGVLPAGVLDRLDVRSFGLPARFDAYANILAALGTGGYRDESLGIAGAVDNGSDHFTCFQFGYDWRRDLAENSARLHQFLQEKREYVRAERERRFGSAVREIRFDIVAHSMGGLLLRYYLRYGATELPDEGPLPPLTWEGAEWVDQAVLVGTPNAGAVQALRDLVEGMEPSRFRPEYEPAVIGTMPAAYQLLPRGRHGALLMSRGGLQERVEDVFDPVLWERMGWGLASPEQDDVLRLLLPGDPDPTSRRRTALEHQQKCLLRAKRVTEALDVPGRPPPGLELHLLAGDAVPTDAVLAVDVETGALEIVERQPGDGTVLRSSALMYERVGGEWSPRLLSPVEWSSVMFLFTDHLGLTEDPTFADNILFLLLEREH